MFISGYFTFSALHKNWQGGGLFYAGGGLFTAACVIGLLVLTIGIGGIRTGITGIFTDPAYNISNIGIRVKIKDAIQVFLSPVYSSGNVMRAFYIIFAVCVMLRKKFPGLKLLVTVYPIIVCLSLHPITVKGSYAAGLYISRLAFLAPFLILLTENKRNIFKKYVIFGWVPSMLCYLVIAVSSYGGGGQAAQCLIFPAMITLAEIVLIVEEVFSCCICADGNGRKLIFSRYAALAVLMISVFCEIFVYYSIVYREASVAELNSKITEGPYKGIYTTADKKEYLEDLNRLMGELTVKDKSCMVLYHSSFAYLMLDMRPATPTTWGIYPHIDNQNSYLQYFSIRPENIPQVIYIVNVPEIYQTDFQNEENYSFCTALQDFLSTNYVMDCNVTDEGIGSIKRYQLIEEREKVYQNRLDSLA